MTSSSETPKRKKSSLGSLWRNSEQFVIRVQCPDNFSLTLVHHIKETCENVLSNVCARLGIVDSELFALAICKDNEYILFPGNKCLSSIFPKWASVTGVSLSDSCMSVDDTMIKTCKMYLRIMHYSSNLCFLNPVSLYHYFYQLRWDALKVQNLLCLEGYEDSYLKLAFLSILATSTDQSMLDSEKGLSSYLPMTVLKSYNVDQVSSMLIEISESLPELSITEAQVCFIELALKLPGICSYLFKVDVIEGSRPVAWNCIASLGPNSIRVFSNAKDKWEQIVKWDVQEIETITYSRQVVSIHCFEYEKDEKKLQLNKTASAKYFAKLSKVMQELDQVGALQNYPNQRRHTGMRRIKCSVGFQDKNCLTSEFSPYCKFKTI